MVFTFSIYFWRKFRRKKKFLWHILKRTKIQPGFCVVKMWEISVSKCLRWRERAELQGLVPGRRAQGRDAWQGLSYPGKSAGGSCRKCGNNSGFLPESPGSWTPAVKRTLSLSTLHTQRKENILQLVNPVSVVGGGSTAKGEGSGAPGSSDQCHG